MYVTKHCYMLKFCSSLDVYVINLHVTYIYIYIYIYIIRIYYLNSFVELFIIIRYSYTVPMRKCWGQHSCISSTFNIAILNGTCTRGSEKTSISYKNGVLLNQTYSGMSSVFTMQY